MFKIINVTFRLHSHAWFEIQSVILTMYTCLNELRHYRVSVHVFVHASVCGKGIFLYANVKKEKNLKHSHHHRHQLTIHPHHQHPH